MVAKNFNLLPNKLNFCCGNYSREETIQGQKLFAMWFHGQLEKKNLEMTLPDNPVYRFLKLTGIQIAFLLRCIYVHT